MPVPKRVFGGARALTWSFYCDSPQMLYLAYSAVPTAKTKEIFVIEV